MSPRVKRLVWTLALLMCSVILHTSWPQPHGVVGRRALNDTAASPGPAVLTEALQATPRDVITQTMDMRRSDLEFQTCEDAVRRQRELVPRSLGYTRVLTNLHDADTDTRQPLPYRSIVLAFSGCRTPKEYFLQGAPERMHMQSLIQAGALILAYTSNRSDVTCWHYAPANVNRDVPMVIESLAALYRLNPGFGNIPLVTTGTSGGAQFSSLFGTILAIRSMLIYVSPLHKDLIDDLAGIRVINRLPEVTSVLPQTWTQRVIPNIMMVYMPKDASAIKYTQAAVTALSRSQVPLRLFAAMPWNFTTNTLHTFLPSRFTPQESAYFFRSVVPTLSPVCVSEGTNNKGNKGSCAIEVDPRYKYTEMWKPLREIVLARHSPSKEYHDGVPITVFPGTCCTSNKKGPPFLSSGLCSSSDVQLAQEIAASPMNDRLLNQTVNAVRKLLKTSHAFHGMPHLFMTQATHALTHLDPLIPAPED
jgi:hypothetical protein